MEQADIVSIDEWIKYWSNNKEKIAMVDTNNNEWSYCKLNTVIDNTAQWLYQNGIKESSVVIICIKNPFLQRVMRFAISRCKAIDVIIYPKISIIEFKERIQILKPDLIITNNKIDEVNTLIFPEEILNNNCKIITNNPNRDKLSHRILFTTGTTGKPKAVLLSEDRLYYVARKNIEERKLKPTDILLSVLPIYHSAGSLFEDSFTIMGGTIILCSNNEGFTFYENLKRYPVTVTTATPTILNKIFCYKDFEKIINKLRLINLAGEKIKENILSLLRKNYKGIITRGYGMTEAGPFISLLSESGLNEATKINSVGHPIEGVEVKIGRKLNEHIGVLFVKSPYLMLGYYNDEIATNKKIKNGWLDTGDIAQIDGGEIYILGRESACIKSGGEFIHPHEVEKVLDSTCEFDEVAVVGIESEEWGERPITFYTLRKRTIDLDLLKSKLSDCLSKYKWPDYFIKLNEIPKNHVGKIDYNELKNIFYKSEYEDYFCLKRG